MPLAVAAAAAGYAGGAQASAFALVEQNASGLGNAYAGVAAVAEDASTIFWNPAGMTRLPGRQVVGALHAIRPKSEFTNTGSAALPGRPLGSNGGDAGDWAFVPNAYLSWQLTPNWFAGLGVNAPFGLKTEYDPTWVGRFHAVKSELKTYNVNPSLAYKLNDQVSFGAGVSWQRADATLSNAVFFGALGEGLAQVEGDDASWGFNLGALFTLGNNTRIGIAYRSAVEYDLSGSVVFANRPAALAGALPDGPITANIKMPASASWSIFHQLNPKWDLLADITWTQWSNIQALNILRTNGTLLSTTPLNWDDTWRFSAGANYHHSSALTLRFGAAFDQSPSNDADRTPRIPDQDRTWLSIGAQYRMSKQAVLDVGYTYIFVKDPVINLCGPATAATAACAGKNQLTGTYDANVNIVSAQFRYSF